MADVEHGELDLVQTIGDALVSLGRPLRTHTVRYGDTLANIAERYYGDQNLYAFIYQHNKRNIDNINQLHPGMTLVIPYHMKEVI